MRSFHWTDAHMRAVTDALDVPYEDAVARKVLGALGPLLCLDPQSQRVVEAIATRATLGLKESRAKSDEEQRVAVDRDALLAILARYVGIPSPRAEALRNALGERGVLCTVLDCEAALEALEQSERKPR